MVKDRIYAMDIQPLLGTGAYRSLRERLTPERRQKADNYIFEKDRLLSAAAGLLLDRALNDAGVTDRRVSFGENGKPHLASRCGVHFNISHTGTLAVCAGASIGAGAGVSSAGVSPVSAGAALSGGAVITVKPPDSFGLSSPESCFEQAEKPSARIESTTQITIAADQSR